MGPQRNLEERSYQLDETRLRHMKATRKLRPLRGPERDLEESQLDETSSYKNLYGARRAALAQAAALGHAAALGQTAAFGQAAAQVYQASGQRINIACSSRTVISRACLQRGH